MPAANDLRAWRGQAVVGITAFAAVVSPSDPFSMLPVMLVGIGAYELLVALMGRSGRH